MGSGFERLMKAIEFERTRSRRLVPKAKRVDTLLSEEKPFFICKDGSKLSVDKRDLEKAIKTLEGDEVEHISFPIYLRTAPALGHGFYQLVGVNGGSEMGRKHSKILFGILGVEPRNFLYSYEVQRIKREIPSIVHIFY